MDNLKFCPYCGKRLEREDQPLRKLDGNLSGILTGLDKEIERIVKDAIFKVIDARLISMIPFDSDTPSAIRYIEIGLEKMKKGEEGASEEKEKIRKEITMSRGLGIYQK